MFHDTHHPGFIVRGSRRAGSKARRSKSLVPLLSSLILIAAMASAEAEPTFDYRLHKCLTVFDLDAKKNAHLLEHYRTMCAAVDDESLQKLWSAWEKAFHSKGPGQFISEVRE
jgi:hypothetical protein